MREERTELLVVGAGPVGLVSALLARKAGLEVLVVDRENRTAARSYACALHPKTLKLLDSLGLADRLVQQGRKITSFAFHDGKEQRAEVKLAPLGGKFPFILIVPQNVLEEALEESLRAAGGAVHWQHRLDDLTERDERVYSLVEKLGGSSSGYIIPHWETVVQQRIQVTSEFLLGADGHNSLVRHRVPLEFTRLSGPEFFAAYEFEAEEEPENVVRVVLDAETTNVLWPLPGKKCRWTFQLVKSEVSHEFPEKERRAVRLAHKVVDENIRNYVQKVAARRAPWFSAKVREITWCTDVVFERRLVKEFGRGRVWLAGDAAHQTGPVGAQSMNVGMCEAADLVNHMLAVVREREPDDSLRTYQEDRQKEWRALLGMSGGLQPGPKTPAWVRERLPRLLACLPGSGTDLQALGTQLGLEC